MCDCLVQSRVGYRVTLFQESRQILGLLRRKKNPIYVGTSTSFKLGVLHTLELGKSIGAQSFL